MSFRSRTPKSPALRVGWRASRRGLLRGHSGRGCRETGSRGVEAIAQVADDTDRHGDRDRAENRDVAPGQNPRVALGVEQVVIAEAIVGHFGSRVA